MTSAVVVTVWSWSWNGFWSELVAGVITFAVGIPFAIWLIERQLSAERKAADREYQRLASEVDAELAAMDAKLTLWAEAKNGVPVAPGEDLGAVWEACAEKWSAFVSAGAFADIRQAHRWYRAASEAAAEWNRDLAENGEVFPTRRADVIGRATNGRVKVQAARKALVAAPSLPSRHGRFRL